MNLHEHSSEQEIMQEFLTPAFVAKCHEFTIAHMPQWRKQFQDGAYPRRIENAFGKGLSRFIDPEDDGCRERFQSLFLTWAAVKLRIAQLKPEIPAKAIWSRYPESVSLHDPEVNAVMTYEQYKWCNRHFSFSTAPEEEREQRWGRGVGGGRGFRRGGR